MRFNPKARANPSQIEHGGSRGGGGGLGGRAGGGGMRLPIPTGGRFGWGTVVVIILFVVLQMCTNGSLPGPDLGQQNGATSGDQPDRPGQDATCTGEMANAEGYDCEVELLTTSIQDYWTRAYEAQTGRAYPDTVTVLFSGQTQSGCGAASSAMGPFYCPNDQRVYIDTSFMEQMLEGQLGAEGGTFALAYVLAHEYGHHLENVLGVLGQVRTQQGPKSDGVKVELMADCLAGAWAKDATSTKDADGNVIIEDLTQDDIGRAIDAAKSVGDDYIQKKGSGRVNEEVWTHGSSEQRMDWFNKGLEEGTIEACNTFAPGAL